MAAALPVASLVVGLLATASPAVASAATAKCQDVTATGGAYLAQQVKVKRISCSTARPKLRSWTRAGASSLPRGTDGWRCARSGSRVSCTKRRSGAKVTFTMARERVAPKITLASPTQGARYELGASVTAAYTCTDNAAIAKCSGTVASGKSISTAEPGAYSFTVTATDKAGNKATKTVTYRVTGRQQPAETTPPIIHLRAPADGATYAPGQTVRADYSCVDNVGVVACDGTVANGSPIATDKAGTFTVSVSATDAAGNMTTEVHSYTVHESNKPTVTVTPPAVLSYKFGDAGGAVTYSCGDDTAIDSCTAKVGNTSVRSGDPLPTTGAPGPGERTLEITAVDSSKNVTTNTDVKYTVTPAGYYALTYDDGPNGPCLVTEDPAGCNYTEKLLAALKSVNAKATFFVTGTAVTTFPEIAKDIFAGGHALENHTFTHANIGSTTDPDDPTVPAPTADPSGELTTTTTAITGIGAPAPAFVRPPYGMFDAATRALANSLGMEVALWTTETNDYTGISAQDIARNAIDGIPATAEDPATKGVKSGGIILMHDNNQRTVDATVLIVNRLRDEKGMLPGKLAKSTTSQFIDGWESAGDGLGFNVEAVAP